MYVTVLFRFVVVDFRVAVVIHFSHVHLSLHKYTCMIQYPSLVSFLLLTYSAHLVQ